MRLFSVGKPLAKEPEIRYNEAAYRKERRRLYEKS